MTSTPDPVDVGAPAELDAATEDVAQPADAAPLDDVADANAAAAAGESGAVDAPAEPAAAAAPPVPTTPTPEELELAAAALHEVTPRGSVGDVLDALLEDGGQAQVLAIRHASALPGYPDWTWTVLLSRGVEGGPTVLEVALLPGDSSLLAPAWVPWSERLADYLAAKEAAGVDGDLDEDDEALESDLESDLEDDFDDDFDDVDVDADAALGHDDEVGAAADADDDGWDDHDGADGRQPS
ncbi:DUF3027 domain-containing protein [Agrococcus jenensis]|uniref:DUF3027 family protein n=1 Tax=Agrococcus jenensis TaxID=46353 RepID=A0A3N2AT65_9MICO|nr:DUF3027 domain-containing protein [Agrococcus jenensis]ROR66210.1 hypothetical protein EDD26_1590 [Agrococcus jenensis]